MFSPERLSFGRRRSARLVAAAAGAAVLVVMALRLAGQDLEVLVRGGVRPVPLGAVVLAAAAGALTGTALTGLAARTARPRRTFWVVVAVGLAVSSAPPVVAAASVPSAAWLLALHAVVAAVVVPRLARSLPSSRSASAGRVGVDEPLAVRAAR